MTSKRHCRSTKPARRRPGHARSIVTRGTCGDLMNPFEPTMCNREHIMGSLTHMM